MNQYKKSVSQLNRWFGERIVPQMVLMFNNGKFKDDYKIFESREYYRNIFNHIATTLETNDFIDNMRIERGTWSQRPSWRIFSLTLPNSSKVGESAVIGIIVDLSIMKASAFCMEISFADYIIGEWAEHKHFNYGDVSSRPKFFSKIISLSEDNFNDIRTRNTGNNSFSETVTKSIKKRKRCLFTRFNRKLSIWCYLAIGGLLVVATIWLINRHDADVSKKPVVVGNSSDNLYKEDNTYKEKENEDRLDERNEELVLSNEFVDDDEDLTGEIFKYYPEDGTIRTSSGKIVSEGFTQNTQRPKPIKNIYKNTTIDDSNEYEGVSITHFANGEYPYLNWYGRGKFDKQSLSSLSISNQSSTDAVVLLIDTSGTVIRNVFVRHKSVYTLRHIPACSCIIKVMCGNDWYAGKNNGPGNPSGGFIKNVVYSVSQWSDAFDFIPKSDTDGIIYPTYEITLHAVPNGNFQTKKSNKNEFFKNEF